MYISLRISFSWSLGGTEVILGMDWLSSLGKIEADFYEMSLKWRKDGEQYEIRGDPTLCHAQTSWKSALKMLKEDGEGYFLNPSFQQQDEGDLGGIPQELQKLLQEFSDIFQLPQGLPPKRDHDHAILLKEGAEIPNIRPYRYPHYQKNEIEKIVSEMLQAASRNNST